MRKQLQLLIGCALFVSSASFGVHEFRSPLSVRRGPMRFPLNYVPDVWWLDDMPEERPETWWCDFEFWSAGFRRFACESYFDCDCEGGSTTKRASLSTLFFGADAFVGEQTFQNAQLSASELFSKNIFLGTSSITPRFDYNEYGVMWGMDMEKCFGKNDEWHAGARVTLPFKIIEIEHDSSCRLEETLDDMVKRVPISNDVNNDPTQVEYAYRLDLLSALAGLGEDAQGPLVQYGTINNTGAPSPELDTLIGGQNVSSVTANDSEINNATVPAVYLVRSDGSSSDDCVDICPCPSTTSNIRVSGEIPCPPLRKTPDQVSGPLGADGSGGGDGDVLFFKRNVNYRESLANDRSAQSTLFVVPRADSADGDDLVGGADVIADTIDTVLQFVEFQESAVEFFRKNGIDLCAHECESALGDLDLDLYAGYGYRGDWFIDYILGLRFPTGTKVRDAKRIYQVPTGNNRHFEVKLGLEGGWRPWHCFAFQAHASFHHAFGRSEKRAVAFEGATIRNIGSEIDADVSWNYGVVRFDLHGFHPWHQELGWTFGYELMAKGEDNIEFDCTCDQVRDLLDRTGTYDASVLENNTNSMTHKLRGEIFHRWNYFELFAGASHVVAGKHAMRETEWHLGFNIVF